MNRIILLLLFLIPIESLAQSPLFNKTTLNFNEVNYKIKCLANNRQGYLYLGTDKGVFCFDGFHFVAVALDSSAQVSVNKIYFDKDDNIWVGDNSGALYFQSSKTNSIIKSKIFKLNASISDIIEDEYGTIWIATFGDGISYVKNGKLVDLAKTTRISDQFIYNMVLIKGEIWYSSDNKIGIIDPIKKLSRAFKFNNLIYDNIVTNINYDAKFALLYIGTQSKGLYQYIFNKDLVQNIYGSNLFGSINKIARNHNEIWLLAEDSGLVHYTHEGDYRVYNKKKNNFVGGITDVNIDREGNFWLCNQTKDLISFNYLFELLEYPREFGNTCSAIYRDKKSVVWFSTPNKLFTYSDNKFHRVLPEIKEFNVVSIHKDMYGFMWFGTFDKGLIRYHPITKKYKIYTEIDGIANNNVLSISAIGNTLWIATLGGVSKISFSNKLERLKQVFNFDKERGLGINFIYQVFVDSKKRIWFATDGKGVTVFDGKKFKNFNTNDGIKSKTIYSITEDAFGVIWLNSAKDGIYSFDGKYFVNYNRINGIRNSENASIITDNHNNLLIISNNSIDILNVKSKQILYHDEELGLKDLNPGLNASFKDNYGNIWIGTSKGIIKYYSHLNNMWNGPHTILKKVSVFYESMTDSLPSHFNYNENYLTFDYIGLWYHKPSEVKYRVQLEGYDIKWYDTKDNTVTYSKLPPGKYVFKVMSSASNDFNSSKVVSYSFSIATPFYSKTWFIVLSIISVLLLFYWLLKWSESRLKEKERYEKDRIAFQLDTLRNQINPHFLFNSFNTLAGIIETDQEKAVLFVEKLSDFYRELLFYREKSLIPLRDELSLLMNYIFLIEQRFSDKINFNININDTLLDSQIAPLSLQLLVENAIKHNSISRDIPLKVEIFTEPHFIVVRNTIQKKNEEIVSMGIGLQNIKSRYHILTNKSVIVLEDEDFFVVKIPLID